MKRFALTLILLLIAPQFSDAQVVKIVRQDCGPLRCRFEVGSGVVIGRSSTADGGNTYRILTAYHVCGNEWSARVKQPVRPGHDYKMTAVTPAGRFPAQIAAWNGDAMLMLLTIDVPAGSTVIGTWPIANALPSAGDAVTIHGYGGSRNCQYGFRSLMLRSVGSQRFETTAPFEQGESGGPIVKNGQIVGICDGYYDDTKCGYGASIVAVRWFLSLPAIGTPAAGGQSPGMPVREPQPAPGLPPGTGLSVPPPGSVVPVPAPPEPTPAVPGSGTGGTGDVAPSAPGGRTPTPAPPRDSGDKQDTGGDAPLFTPPEHITGKRPAPEPDPISNPPSAGDQAATKPPGKSDSVGSKIARATAFGLDLWSVAAGVGLVAGTGGIGGIGLLAWRGLKAGKAVAGVVRQRRQRPVEFHPPSPDQPAPQSPIHLPPQEANFVEVPVDYRREAVDWALAKHGQKYPGSIPVLEGVAALINQRLQSQGHGPETLHHSPSY